MSDVYVIVGTFFDKQVFKKAQVVSVFDTLNGAVYELVAMGASNHMVVEPEGKYTTWSFKEEGTEEVYHYYIVPKELQSE